MSDLVNTTAVLAGDELIGVAPCSALAELIGNRWTYQQIAAALGCTERAIYMLVDKHRIPYVRVLSRRYVDPKAVRAALLRDQANTPACGRGRPRRTDAARYTEQCDPARDRNSTSSRVNDRRPQTRTRSAVA
jgi:excisionase family DNA binding protein